MQAAKYVGQDACVECHAEQVKLWQRSHHDLAMQHADDETVLADFNNTHFTYAGITSTFYKKNNKFMVRTDRPDGKLRDYQIKYVFGVTPLQQYLVELDKGHLQALTIAWDTRDRKEGGQRWFHLYPDEEITYTDELHWTRTRFNWNSLCAECHMPPRNYMVVDPRHDHSFRIPRPDLSVELGTPNVCNQCHADKDAAWAAAQVKQWYGQTPGGHQQFAHALDAGRNGNNDAGMLLAEQINQIDTPDIARASAISLLPRYLDQSTFSVIQSGLGDHNAMVRAASVAALEGVQPAMLVQLVFPLLDDPVRSVRIEAARVFAPVPVGKLQGDQLSICNKAADELEAGASLAPENARYIYVYAVALDSAGRADEAVKQLQIAHERFPSNVEIVQALVAFNRDAGNAFAAQRYMKKLENLE